MEDIIEEIQQKLAQAEHVFRSAGEAGGYSPDDTYVPVSWINDRMLGIDGSGEQIFALYNVSKGEYLLKENGEPFQPGIPELTWNEAAEMADENGWKIPDVPTFALPSRAQQENHSILHDVLDAVKGLVSRDPEETHDCAVSSTPIKPVPQR